VKQLLQTAHQVDDGPPYWSRWSRDYDYLYVLFTDPDYANPDPMRLEPLYVGDRFVLYRINGPQVAYAEPQAEPPLALDPADNHVGPLQPAHATAGPEAVARPGAGNGLGKARPVPTAARPRTVVQGPVSAKPGHIRPVRLERVSASPQTHNVLRDTTRPRTLRRHGARPVSDRGTRKVS
jgi:hypothetical protein